MTPDGAVLYALGMVAMQYGGKMIVLCGDARPLDLDVVVHDGFIVVEARYASADGSESGDSRGLGSDGCWIPRRF